MKIAFLSEYFDPFVFGGSEISTQYLAEGLNKYDRQEIIIIAPDFGLPKKYKSKNKLRVIRYWFPKRIKSSKLISTFWHTSILVSLYRTLAILRICAREKIDIIHVQEKYLLPAGFLVAKILKKPLIITIRDYQLLCNLGFCISKKRNYKRCNFLEYWLNDAVFYFQNYHQKSSWFKKFLVVIFLLRARLIKNFYYFLLERANKKIAISKKQALIYKNNGIKDIETIYNLMKFSKPHLLNKKNLILYIGKISLGKGIDLFINSLKIVFKEYPNLRVELVGNGENLNWAKKITQLAGIDKKIYFRSFTPHREVINLIRRAKLIVVPSRWEEPFGRVALESISQLTPVVVTESGGLPEIVDKNYGAVCEANPNDLAKGINYVLKNNLRIISSIEKDYQKIKKKFETDVIVNHIKVYSELIK